LRTDRSVVGLKSGGLLDGLEDTHVAGAAAEVAGQAFFDFIEGGVGVLVEQVVGGEDHAGGADAALGSAFFEEALLDGMEMGWVAEAFDGEDGRLVGLKRGDEAGVDQLAVEQDGAGSALAFAAAFLGAGEVEVFAKDVEEAAHRGSGEGVWRVVDGEVDEAHAVVASASESLLQGLKAALWWVVRLEAEALGYLEASANADCLRG
jgi:hypothetical protein